MLIQKRFHLAMKREIAMSRMLDLRGYRSALIGLERTTFEPNGLLQLRVRLPWGFLARFCLARELGEDPSQILFRSHGGNVELFGALHFAEIRPGLTEVSLAMEYEIGPKVHRWIDRYRHGVEKLLDDQISALETHFMQPLRGMRADRDLPTPMNGHHHDTDNPG